MRDISEFCVMLLIVWLLFQLPSCSSRDDSDPPDGRSGMNVYKDALTGCEYLSHGISGLMPRMDKDFKQICRK